jgi:hypothetical protein
LVAKRRTSHAATAISARTAMNAKMNVSVCILWSPAFGRSHMLVSTNTNLIFQIGPDVSESRSSRNIPKRSVNRRITPEISPIL